MLTGLLLTLGNAVIMAAFNIVLQMAARRRVALLPFYALYSLIACALALAFYGVAQGFTPDASPRFLLLAGLTILSSLASAVALLCSSTAMQRGHAGAVFTITQSAMAVSL